MRKIVYLLPFIFFFFFLSCGNTGKTEDQKIRQAIKKAQVKTMKVIQYSYKFGEPDMTTGKVLLVADYDKSGNVIKEVLPTKVITYAYKEEDKVQRLSDVQELNSEFLLQYQTNYSYPEGGSVSASRFTADQDIVSKTVINKNALGQDTSVVVYNKGGLITTKTIIRYDDLGLSESLVYNNQDEVVAKTIRIAGDKNRRNFVSYNEIGMPILVFTEYYDDNNRLIEYLTSSDLKEQFKHFKRSYNNDLLEDEVEFYINGEPKSITKYTYEK